MKKSSAANRMVPSLHAKKSQPGVSCETELDVEFRRISSLNVPQMIKEMETLNKKFSPGGPHYFTLISSYYLAWRLGKEAPRLALQELQKYPRLHYYAICPLMNGWAEKDPDDIINWFSENKSFISSQFLLSSSMASTFVKANPDKALTWIKSIDDGSLFATFAASFDAMLSFHPEKTKDYLAFLQSKWPDEEFANSIISEDLAKKNWEAAVRLILSSPEQVQSSMWSHAIAALATVDPEKAMLEWEKQDTASKDKTLRPLMDSLLRISSVKAFEWLTAHVSEDRATQLLNEDRSLHIFHSDSPAFQQYVGKMPQGRFKDAILEKMIDHGSSAFMFELNFKNYQPDTVFSWIALLDDEQKKVSYMNKFLFDWAEESPDKALKWLKDNNLPESQKQRFTESINSRLNPEK